MNDSPGIAHFLSQSDGIACCVLLVLVLMSVLSWYLIALKAWQFQRLNARSRGFLSAFRGARNLVEAERLLAEGAAADPFAQVLAEGVDACRLLGSDEGRRGFDLTSPDDFVSAALNRAIASASRHFDEGLSALASIGSTAPFVGLFGTVWGIYHALIAIGASGQGSLDRVAGPVGEALVMTACGLAVAIPAVLAYNAFVRINRQRVGELEGHAHEVFSLLGLGRKAVSAVESAAPMGAFSPVLEQGGRR